MRTPPLLHYEWVAQAYIDTCSGPAANTPAVRADACCLDAH